MRGLDNLKTGKKKLEATEIYLWRILKITWPARKSNETVLREADITRSLINRIVKARKPFWPFNKKGKNGTSWVNWNDREKIQDGKTA